MLEAGVWLLLLSFVLQCPIHLSKDEANILVMDVSRFESNQTLVTSHSAHAPAYF